MKDAKRFILKNYKAIALWSIILLLPAVYFIVYFTGGTQYVYSHLMYIPILLAGIFLGGPFGAITGVIAGIILGPFMPLDVMDNISQTPLNWGFRLMIFFIIGGISGIFSDIFRKRIKLLSNILWVNPETNIPNVYSLKHLEKNDYYYVVTVKLANRDYLISIFGMNIMNRILYKTYRNLLENLPLGSHVFNSDNDKLWCLVKEENEDEVKTYMINALDNDVIIKTANIYVEYYIGFGKYKSLDEIKTLEPFKKTDACARAAENNNVPYIRCDDNLAAQTIDTDLLSDFYNALKNEETFLSYHPVYDVNSLEIFKLEALIRWMHPKKGLINPNDFIPLIENTQLIHPLMDWVLNKIVEKAEEFKQKGIKTRIFMNISAKNFYNQNLVYKITKRIHEKNLNPSLIGFEITESVIFSDIEESQEMVKQLSDLGIGISIDDFGKGYSSLGYLSRFKIDYLKIDKTFISRIDNPTNYEVIKATLNLAKQLNFKTVAEGVEDYKTLKKVIDVGFDFAQGFYFCKPIPQDQIVDYYKKNVKITIKE